MGGGAGKALRGGGARRKNTSPAAQVKDGAYGRPPHPARLAPGQIYWPRQGRARRHALTVTRIGADGRVSVKRAGADGSTATLSSARLLTRRADGQGRFYAFLRWSPKRYTTWAFVATVNDGTALLVLPEWHPGRPVAVAQACLPVGARTRGAWLTVTADLSQPTGAGVQVAPLCAGAPPADVPQPCWRPRSAEPLERGTPLAGRGCGDIVLEQVEALDDRSFFVRERPSGLAPGGHVYLARDGEVVGFVALESWRLSPNGVRLECGARLEGLSPRIPLDGPREPGRWRWRWWQIEGGAA